MKDKEAFQARKDKQLSGKAQSLFAADLQRRLPGLPTVGTGHSRFPGALLGTGALKSRDPALFTPCPSPVPVPARPWQLLPNNTKEPFPIP